MTYPDWPPTWQRRSPDPLDWEPGRTHPHRMRLDIDRLETRVSDHDKLITKVKHYGQIAAFLLIVAANIGREATIELIIKLLKGG